MAAYVEIEIAVTPDDIWQAVDEVDEVRKNMASLAYALRCKGMKDSTMWELAMDAAEVCRAACEVFSHNVTAAGKDIFMQAHEGTKVLVKQWQFEGQGAMHRRLPAQYRAQNAARIIIAGLDIVKRGHMDLIDAWEQLPRVQEAMAKAKARNKELEAERDGDITPIVLVDDYLDEEPPEIPDWLEDMLLEAEAVRDVEYPSR